MGSSHLFSLTNQVFWGLLISVAYGAVTAGVVYWLDSNLIGAYAETFVILFNCIISGGLIIGSALFVYSSQDDVPHFEALGMDVEKVRISVRRSLAYLT